MSKYENFNTEYIVKKYVSLSEKCVSKKIQLNLEENFLSWRVYSIVKLYGFAVIFWVWVADSENRGFACAKLSKALKLAKIPLFKGISQCF